LIAEYKIFGNYREIVNLKDIEYCSAMRDPNSAGSKLVLMFHHLCQGMVHPCPYRVGPLRISNFSDPFQAEMDNIDASVNLTDSFNKLAYRGDVRIKIQLKADDDPKLADFMLAYTIKFRRASSFWLPNAEKSWLKSHLEFTFGE